MTDKTAPHTPRVPPVYQPAKWDLPEVHAIQACFEGRATPEQQKVAMDWIVYKAACTDDVEYRTEDRDHAFSSGRRFVGLQIRKLQGLNIGLISQHQRS